MMKHIYRNGSTTPPKDIYRCVDEQPVKVKKAWRAISSTEYVKVWDISDKEYLKIDEYYIGQKFLEKYEVQYVYTSVYWVHDTNGVTTETRLSTSELQSWECNTLEPGYYADGDRQYVGYYQITRESAYGQHDMKITYKSPETGNILEVEYPIYHLMEYKLMMDSTEFDWYPFRFLFAETSISGCVCPAGTLEYRCNAKNGDLITDYKHQDFTIQYANYIFPETDNARYHFGENQRIEMQYLSDAGKLWTQILYVNVRPYTDTRNRDYSRYKGVTTYHKDVTPLSFEIKLEDGAFEPSPETGINSVKSLDLNEDSVRLDENGDLLPFQYSNSQNISSSDEAGFKVHFFTYCGFPLLNPTFKVVDGASGQYSNVQKVPCLESADFFTSYYDFFDYLQNCTKNEYRIVKYGYGTTVVVEPAQLFGNNSELAGSFASMESHLAGQCKESSSLGYIYWGDGTFDIYSFSNYLTTDGFDLIKPTNKKTNMLCTYADGSDRQVATYPIYWNSTNSTLRCGNTIENEKIVAKYENETIIKRHHTYDGIDGLSQNYTISITCCASFSDDDDYGSILKLNCRGTGTFMTYFNDITRDTSKWCSPTLGYASQSEILEMVDKSYYYYHNTEGGENHEIYGVEQVNGAMLTADGGILANCIEVDRGDYYCPVRELASTSPTGNSNESISGFAPLSILKNIKFGSCLTYRKAYTSANYMMTTYLDLGYTNVSMFMHDVTIDIKNICNINVNHTTSLNNVNFGYSYANLENKIHFAIFSGERGHVSEKLYFNPLSRGWSAVEKNFYNEGVSDKPHLLLEGNLPHHPQRLQNLGICVNATKETNSSGKEYLRVARIPQYRENGIAIVCGDEVVTLSDLYPDRYPLER